MGLKRYYVAPRSNRYMAVEAIHYNGASALFAGCDEINKRYGTSFIASDCWLLGWGEEV